MSRVTTHRCERARAAISLELDSELSPLELAFLERHLARCPGCTAFYAACARFTKELRSAPPNVPTRSARDVAYRRRVRRRALPRAGVAAASFAVVALAGLYGVGQVERVTATPERQAPARPAYFESTDFELGLLRPAHAKRGTNNHFAI